MHFFTGALAEFQHVNCMIVQIWQVKGVACYARAESFTEAVASVASMVATPLHCKGHTIVYPDVVKVVTTKNALSISNR